MVTPEIKDDAVKTKGYFIYPSQLFVNVVKNANRNSKTDIIDSFFTYAQKKQQEEADALIADEKLNESAARRFMALSLRREYVSENGTDFNNILPKISPLNPKYLLIKRNVFNKLANFIEKFKGIGGNF